MNKGIVALGGAALLALVWVFTGQGGDEEDGRTIAYHVLAEPGPVEIPFDVFRGEIRMHGEINGKTVRILIDNGRLWDDLLFFGSEEVDALGLSYGGEVSVGGSGSGEPVPARDAYGVTLSFPGIDFVDQNAVVTSFVPGAPNMWEGSEGQISAALFSHFVVEMDFEKLLIILHDPSSYEYDGGGVELPLTEMPTGAWSFPGAIALPGRTPVEVDLAMDVGSGNPLQIALDSGHDFELPSGAVPASLGFGMQGEMLGHYAPVSRLIIGTYEFETFSAFEPKTQIDEVQVGFDIFARSHVVFDYPHDRIYLHPNRYSHEGYPIEISGMILQTREQGGVEIKGVLQQSLAFEADLQKSDHLVAVGDVDVAALGLWEVLALLSANETTNVTVARGEGQHSAPLPVRRARYFGDDEMYVNRD